MGEYRTVESENRSKEIFSSEIQTHDDGAVEGLNDTVTGKHEKLPTPDDGTNSRSTNGQKQASSRKQSIPSIQPDRATGGG